MIPLYIKKKKNATPSTIKANVDHIAAIMPLMFFRLPVGLLFISLMQEKIFNSQSYNFVAISPTLHPTFFSSKPTLPPEELS
jgi:hypothetical protein